MPPIDLRIGFHTVQQIETVAKVVNESTSLMVDLSGKNWIPGLGTEW